MKNLKFIRLLVFTYLISMGGCSNDTLTKELVKDALPCNVDSEILKSVKDRVGTIYYNSPEKKYALHTTFQGTFDSRDLGFLCNPPDSLKKDGLSITFDGNYYPYEEGRVPPIGGAAYYYLTIIKLKIN